MRTPGTPRLPTLNPQVSGSNPEGRTKDVFTFGGVTSSRFSCVEVLHTGVTLLRDPAADVEPAWHACGPNVAAAAGLKCLYGGAVAASSRSEIVVRRRRRVFGPRPTAARR